MAKHATRNNKPQNQQSPKPQQHESHQLQHRQNARQEPNRHSRFISQHHPHPSPIPSEKNKKGHGCLLFIAMLFILMLAIAAFAFIKPPFAQPIFEKVAKALPIESESNNNAASGSSPDMLNVSDPSASKDQLAQQKANQMHTCRLLAQCQGVDIYSPVPQDEITGILMHQASYEWGQVMTTELPEANLEEIYEDGKYLRVNDQQTEGLWCDADAAHLYRETDDTEMDTSIDCGAKAGTTLYSPVTGTVIAVTNYDLYDEVPDVRIHIRPDANPSLDVVLLHQTDPMIKAGDKVEAGITPISKVRDIASDLTDVQLGFYTADNDPGNHSHIQVNDLQNNAYIEKYLKDVRL